MLANTHYECFLEYYSRCESGALLVAGDELDILNTATVGDLNGGDNLAVIKAPEAESVGLLDTKGRDRLENAQGHDKVGSEDNVLLEVDGQTVGAELLFENVELRAS